jgi:hypothetical protein
MVNCVEEKGYNRTHTERTLLYFDLAISAIISFRFFLLCIVFLFGMGEVFGTRFEFLAKIKMVHKEQGWVARIK